MNEAVKFIKNYNSMCKASDCDTCPLSSDNNGTGMACHIFIKAYPEQAVKIIEAWVKEHLPKTYLQDFLEKYPNAPMENDNVPCACRTHLYPGEANCGFCDECWAEPMEE